jgi:two-component system KDP operon response regulator KdpE
VEDDPAMAHVVVAALEGRGYAVDVARDGRSALRDASVLEPDVIVLDLGLPDVDGVEVCRQLRRWTATPILVLSADGDELRKVAALDEGADDYVTKPFSMLELLARLRVALRHRQMADLQPDPNAVELGSLRVDTAGHRATLEGEPLTLTRKEFALLAVLARNSGRVLTHTTLLTKVWGSADDAKIATLRVHVTQLRRKLGSGPGRPELRSEPGVGYRLTEGTDPSD